MNRNRVEPSSRIRIDQRSPARSSLAGFRYDQPVRHTLIRMARRRFVFRQAETGRAEQSHKWTVDPFRRLAGDAGYPFRAVLLDDGGLYSVHALGVPS